MAGLRTFRVLTITNSTDYNHDDDDDDVDLLTFDDVFIGI